MKVNQNTPRRGEPGGQCNTANCKGKVPLHPRWTGGFCVNCSGKREPAPLQHELKSREVRLTIRSQPTRERGNRGGHNHPGRWPFSLKK